MRVKVCGMIDQKQLITIDPLVNYVGFIFYEKSPRFIENRIVSQHAKRVGVFVNQTESYIKHQIVKHDLDIVQLHGNESPDLCKSLRGDAQVFKAFGIQSEEDILKTETYADAVDCFLFDTKTPKYGGSGIRFDWELLSKYQLDIPFMLSGGIQMSHAEEIRKISHPQFEGIDINSGFEISPGNKNVQLIKSFIHAIHN